MTPTLTSEPKPFTVKDVLDTVLLPDHGVLAILDRTGDTRVTWSRSNQGEVDVARAAFDGARAKGHMAYKITADGQRGEVIKDFDPMAERIILRPPMQGGR